MTTPEADRITTAEVARMLGIAPLSVRSAMRRAAIEPLGREAGKGGASVYPRAAVAWLVTHSPRRGSRRRQAS